MPPFLYPQRGGRALRALHECDPHFLSRERKRASPVQKKGVPHCKRAARRAAMLAESGTYQAVYLNDLTIFYLRCRFACNSLPLRNLRLLWICADLLLPAKAALLGLAAICALSIAGDYTAPKQDSRAAADNRSRGKSYSRTNGGERQQYRHAGSCIPEAKSPFEPETANLIPFSWGSKGDILFREREYPPFTRVLRGRREISKGSLSL